jgi:hypothetical protein
MNQARIALEALMLQPLLKPLAAQCGEMDAVILPEFSQLLARELDAYEFHG